MCMRPPVSAMQSVKNGFWEGIGFINEVGDTIVNTALRLPDATKLIFDLGVVAGGADYDGSADKNITSHIKLAGEGMTSLADATESTNPYTRGRAWGAMFMTGASVRFG